MGLMRGLLILGLLISTACAASVMQLATEMAPLTRYQPTVGDEMRPALEALTKTLQKGEYTVRIVSPAEMITIYGSSAYEINDRRSKTIYLDATESINTQFETLAHEAGHIFHAPMNERDVAEVFAELVGNQVQHFYGSQTATQTSAAYLAQFKHAFPAVQYLRRDMEIAVKVLTNQAAWPRWE